MLSLLPFPFNILAGVVLSLIQKLVVPKLPVADQVFATEFITFLQTGHWSPSLTAASEAHSAASASTASAEKAK